MKAITVRQPWAWAIAHGGKNVENRSAGTRHRGPLAIHAGLSYSRRGTVDHRVRLRHLGVALSVLPLGAIIAVADVADSHPDAGCCRPWGESSYQEAGGRVRTAIHHLVLEDVRPLDEPIPCRGALGLWRVPADIAEQLCGVS